MRRNCNLKLRLVEPSNPFLHTADYEHDHLRPPMSDVISGSPKERQLQQEQQQMTIFYNGKVSVCDVTELQARAIIMFANREMEENMKKTPSNSEASSPILLPSSQLTSPTTPTSSLSMKRSLQQFLQKRKHRIQATSPYNH